MSDRLFALRLFARVARKGSFSAAGRELNIPQSTASRTIATLEREIGAALFVRTTRAVTLTDAGLDFLARIESVLAELDEAEHAARGTGELRGILRIGLATTFAAREVIPRLSDFMSRHPALRIDLMMGDEREDLVVEGVDVALRFGPLSDSTATVRRILVWPRVLAASRAYLDKAGAPLTPTDLAQHAIILGPRKPWRPLVLSQGRYCDLVCSRGQVDNKRKLGRYRGGRRRIGHRHDSARRLPSGIGERRARSAVTGMGRGNGRAQRRLRERQSRQVISASLCRLLDRSASPD
jgi:DNA-binding transcriptional LysR family regulator